MRVVVFLALVPATIVVFFACAVRAAIVAEGDVLAYTAGITAHIVFRANDYITMTASNSVILHVFVAHVA